MKTLKIVTLVCVIISCVIVLYCKNTIKNNPESIITKEDILRVDAARYKGPRSNKEGNFEKESNDDDELDIDYNINK